MELSSVVIVLVLFLIVSLQSGKKKQKAKTQKVMSAYRQKQRQPDPEEEEEDAFIPDPVPSAAPAPVPAPDRTPITPRVSVTPHNHENMYGGSMEYDGSEGNPDTFDDMPSSHSEELFLTKDDTDQTVPQSGLRLNFSPDSIASAFILQEVLKRPDRTKGYRNIS